MEFWPLKDYCNSYEIERPGCAAKRLIGRNKMMSPNFHEIDWRIQPLRNVIVGINAGLAAIQKRLDTEGWFDGIWAREYAEPLFGLGFVAAQTYALGTVTDLISVRMSRGKSKEDKLEEFKKVCYACDTVVLRGGVKRIQIINASANYFKHHDEWGARWPRNYNTETLDKVGINEKTEFPCIDAVDLLCGTSWELIVLHQILKEWRAHLFSTLL